ncbi:MAG: hypothetical protein Q9191_001880 [Dirinaria sp. TL-2023a]
MLVHGAWHTPSHYESFIAQLHRANFEVLCPLLPTCSPSTHPAATLSTDAQTIRSHLLPLLSKSRDVIMLLHSYGGAAGSEAVRDLSKTSRGAQNLSGGGVVHLIYMCAFMLQVGESVGSASLPRPVPEPVERDERTGTTFLREPPVALFYADVDPEVAERMQDMLVRQAGAAMSDQVTYPAWREVPSTYLRMSEDRVLFPEWQDRQICAVREAGVEVAVEEFQASHSPYLSLTPEMVAFLERVAKQYMGVASGE